MSEDLEQFRAETRAWLEANCPQSMRSTFTSEDEIVWGGKNAKFANPDSKLWLDRMAERGWTAPMWPKKYGGGGLSNAENAVLQAELKRINARPPLYSFGLWMLGPVLLEYANEEQKLEHLPKIVRGEIRWCQGYSEPGAGSDLAAVKTRARLDEASGNWLINGQKVWTSLAHESQWCFVIARTDPDSVGHAGLGFFLVKMDQPGVTVRPIEQITGTSEFNEVFFDDAVCEANDMLGKPGDGWKIGMALLGFERGTSTLGQQMLFQNELDEIVRIARENGRGKDPALRQRIADAWIGLRIMRYNAMRMLSGPQDGSLAREATAYKLYWAVWHRNLGKLAMDVLGPEAEIVESGPYNLGRLQSLFLFTRSDTIYGGTNQIQRNIIAERALGMPKEPRPAR